MASRRCSLGAGWVALRAFRGQQKEFVRQVRQLERQQADAIDLTGWEEGAVACVPSPTTPLPQPKAILAIENKSLRPVRQVRCRLWPQGDDQCATPYATGPMDRSDRSSRPLVFPQHATTVPLLRPGAWLAFLFDEPCKDEMKYAVRFVDDAGLHWQIDRDLHLQRVDHPSGW